MGNIGVRFRGLMAAGLRSTLVTCLCSMALLVAASGASRASTYGTLSNFDVVNDTGHECHGFEIELEDFHVGDVYCTFGGSYSRYGVPQVVDATVDPAHPRVIVRYRQWNGSRWEATPVAPGAVTPSGHDCYAGGPIGNYLSSGCEHYGVCTGANPTKTSYRWLVAANPGDPNSSFSVAPENVQIPVPAWNVAPIAGGGANVRAEVEPVEEENHAQYGEPQWLKVFKIESDRNLQPEDINLLLLGLAGGLVPADDTEIETEWKLIQSKPGDAEGVEEDAEINEDPLDAGKQSVIRRYEFYRYTGQFDPENHEARPCVADDSPVPDAEPLAGCSDLGDFVGAQNVAVDVEFSAVDNALPSGEVGVAYPNPPLVIGGLPPYTVEIAGGTLPPGLQIDGVTGVLSGTPTQAGSFSFSIGATDAVGGVVNATFDVTVTEDLCPGDPDKMAPGACGCGVSDNDWDGDGLADCVDVCPLDPPGYGTACDSAPNACGQVAQGTVQCDGSCSAVTPPVADGDGDGTPDCNDLCPGDPGKASPGVCGCGVADTDGNGNGVADCLEAVSADLALKIEREPNHARVRREVKHSIKVKNRGPITSPSATVTFRCTGVAYRFVDMPRGCAVDGGSVICALRKLPVGEDVEKEIKLVPATAGTLSCTAVVAGTLPDPVSTNQSMTVETRVR